ncbi:MULTISPECIES: PQQ-dependent sugar dehydrogenase [Chryseobacterium]|uniref:Glucose/arabinose dehydrogenase n=1 Tax=Chryseobacterium camelliae TaxID=1265445 RepID=A0ABU0TI88_9FLAO|nr:MULTISPECIES: sorbosone dehydrogenase family protein [Chryseobacterium]MDT3409362.1 glucose/arabinose dehydrogenase [Pseudacidovorax intermedius]MDQ1096773.1 glucose/arabinose dehydrogenase [Chryseobacterium camelliae]MDQ1100716.1 glucose/arabinose dehydrogenase [Chryseobacterium sp. SORGH_AS_1048]MDR6088055.1 glucose/arabinose dehydrogenase [Chryseobacterium sp. SORGH_AS_0909]MDR6132429.1 glucose/arabinose dehydrogenase [Chryseobacterium sp. SORGH_AS_1175]
MRKYILPSVIVILASCKDQKKQDVTTKSEVATQTDTLKLPAPDEKGAKNKFSNVIGWPAGKAPTAPEGFTVTRFAEDIKSPRNMIQAPNGDVFVVLSNSERSATEKVKNDISGKSNAEVGGKSANRILVYRDANKDGIPETSSVFIDNLNQPYGMLIIKDQFYVANTDGLWVYPYKQGDLKISGPGKKMLNLPAGGYNNHWTRNLIANKDQSKIYVSVGSGSNVGENGMENEVRRANILEINPDGSGEIIFASGLRNPVGMSWNPVTGALWTVVNERDELGDELVPDYLTSVKKGAFYGWPYAYFGKHEDPRRKGERPDLVAKTIVPDVPLGSHTASLGLDFYKGAQFPQKYKNGAFIGQHGSWNRSSLVGYQVAFVPFANGKASGTYEPFLSGFIADKEKGDVYGRPVGVLQLADGSLLVADDVGGIVWRVSYSKK